MFRRRFDLGKSRQRHSTARAAIPFYAWVDLMELAITPIGAFSLAHHKISGRPAVPSQPKRTARDDCSSISLALSLRRVLIPRYHPNKVDNRMVDPSYRSIDALDTWLIDLAGNTATTDAGLGILLDARGRKGSRT